eukprot:5167465-Alexandrium_andersonii.AAC.1
MKRTVWPGRRLPVSLARQKVAKAILKLAMATSSGPATMMSPTQRRSQTVEATLKKRQASALQRVNTCLMRKSDRFCSHEAGADRSPR